MVDMTYLVGNISLFFDLLLNGKLDVLAIILVPLPSLVFGYALWASAAGRSVLVAAYGITLLILIQLLVFGLLNNRVLVLTPYSVFGSNFETKLKLDENNSQLAVVNKICFTSTKIENYSTFNCSPETNKAIYASVTPQMLEKDSRLVNMLEALKNFAVESVESIKAFEHNKAYVEKYMPHLKEVYLKEVDLALASSINKNLAVVSEMKKMIQLSELESSKEQKDLSKQKELLDGISKEIGELKLHVPKQ